MYLFLFILTLLLSAIFSGSETAYISSNRIKLRLRTHQEPEKQFSNFLVQSDQTFLTTTLVGNNIVMVACSSLAIVVFSAFFNESVLVLVTSAFLLIFGEIIPKSIATLIPNRISVSSPSLLMMFYFLFYPLIYISELFSKQLLKLFKSHEDNINSVFSKTKLPMLVREYAHRELIDKTGRLMLHRAINIADKRVHDVRIPRTEMVSCEINTDREEIVKLFHNSGFSRLPIYREHVDQIEGFLYVLDFLTEPITDVLPLRSPLMFPAHMRALDALKEFKQNCKSIAIVVDEHGGTDGLITLEDIVEELFGSIIDEYDVSEVLIKSVDEKSIVADGRAEIDHLREQYNLDLPEGDYVTISGLVENKLGRVPERGDYVQLDDIKIMVLDSSKTKINKVRIDQNVQAVKENQTD
ncbi:MAG: hemolysin family protein [candidate division KSB1 bacterium]|nr:hemolysin family protein [candidate division KSB1 bacterium]